MFATYLRAAVEAALRPLLHVYFETDTYLLRGCAAAGAADRAQQYANDPAAAVGDAADALTDAVGAAAGGAQRAVRTGREGVDDSAGRAPRAHHSQPSPPSALLYLFKAAYGGVARWQPQ